jgi:hypothetical protein
MDDGEKSEAGNGEFVTHCVALRCASTLLQYTGQWSFQYNYITATREIQTAVRKNLSYTQQQTLDYLLKQQKVQEFMTSSDSKP